MRIVSWNMRAGGGRRNQGIANQLRRWNPGIVALGEFRGTDSSCEIAQSLMDSGRCYQCDTTDGVQPAINALLIASRWPIRAIRIEHAPQHRHRWLHVKLSGPLGLAILAVHVPDRSSGRKNPFLNAIAGNCRYPTAESIGAGRVGRHRGFASLGSGREGRWWRCRRPRNSR